MRTNVVVGSVVVLGIVLALAARVAAPVPLVLVADAQAPVGQTYVVAVQGIPPDARNVSLRISASVGDILFRQYANFTPSVVESVPVTRDWGWGNGYVEFAFDNRTGNETRTYQMRESFEVTCPPPCQIAYMNEAADRAAQPLYLLTGLAVFLAAAFAAHAATVYAAESGGSSWKDTLGLFARSRIARDALYRSKKDALNILPESLKVNLAVITSTLNDIESSGRFKRRALRAARKSRNILAKAGVYERSPSANHETASKPPERTSRIAKPTRAAEFDKRMMEE